MSASDVDGRTLMSAMEKCETGPIFDRESCELKAHKDAAAKAAPAAQEPAQQDVGAAGTSTISESAAGQWWDKNNNEGPGSNGSAQ